MIHLIGQHSGRILSFGSPVSRLSRRTEKFSRNLIALYIDLADTDRMSVSIVVQAVDTQPDMNRLVHQRNEKGQLSAPERGRRLPFLLNRVAHSVVDGNS